MVAPPFGRPCPCLQRRRGRVHPQFVEDLQQLHVPPAESLSRHHRTSLLRVLLPSSAEHPTPPRPFYGLPIQLLARLDQRLRQPSGELLLLRQLCCVFHGFDGLLTRDFWQLRHTHLEPLQPSGRDGV